MQDLQEPLDAAVLSVDAVQRNERDVVGPRDEARHEVVRGEVEQVDALESGLAEGRLALRGGAQRDLPLVRPTAANDHDALAQQLLSVHRCPFAPARMR